MRGGSYTDGSPFSLSSSARKQLSSGSRLPFVGFRCVIAHRDVSKTPPPTTPVPQKPVVVPPPTLKPAPAIPPPGSGDPIIGRWRLDGKPIVFAPNGSFQNSNPSSIEKGTWKLNSNRNSRPLQYKLSWGTRLDEVSLNVDNKLQRRIKKKREVYELVVVGNREQ